MSFYRHLSKRLQMNASCVTPGFRLADVGTDHGYIPIALVTEGVIPSALAMDVNQGPLKRALQHIQEHQLENYIGTRLSDGVQSLHPGEADSVLIAGMGGALTVRILTEGKEVLDTVKEIILQPQSEIGKVRRFLYENQYQIVREDMVLEDRKYYTVMKAVHGEMRDYTDMDFAYGRLLLDQKHPVLKQYLTEEKEKLEELLRHLMEQNALSESTKSRIESLQEEQALVSAALDRLQ